MRSRKVLESSKNLNPILLAVGVLVLCAWGHIFAAAQNKLIAKRLRWKIVSTEHFDIYYYPGLERLLETTARILEEAYARATPSLGIKIPKRSRFFIFQNHNEFEQNNIVDVGEGTGGVTEAFKDRFLAFNDGSQTWLEHVAGHEFVHVCQFQVLYSGFWRSARLLKSFLYPLWFLEGMPEYYSAHRDEPQKEMVLRDAVTSKTWIPLGMLHNFNHVKPHQITQSYKTGNAAIEYIAREYGEDKIGMLLKTLSEKFDMNSTLNEVLGLSLPDLDAKLEEDLEEKYREEIQELHEPDFYGKPLTKPDEIYPVFDSNPIFFPDGKSFAFLSDKSGYEELFRYDLGLGRAVSCEIQKRFPHKVEVIHGGGSGLSVSSDGRFILFGGERKERDFLYLYDVQRDTLKALKFPLDGVKSPQFFPDARRIAFIGMKNGLNDIYLCDKNGRGLKKLTDTFSDEGDIRIFPDGKTILFSRENPPSESTREYQRDLWTLDLRTMQENRITSIPGNETQPAISPSGKEILLVNDGTGRYELYRLLLGFSPVQMTKTIGGNFFPEYFPMEDRFLFVSHRAGEQHVYESARAKTIETANEALPESGGSAEKKGAESNQILKSTASVFVEPPRKYRLRASTDFFFPIFFYSSTDGLFLSAYWQASEMLGNHQISVAATYASALNYLNYQVLYSYLKFRPQFFFGVAGDTQDNVFLTTREQRREEVQFVGITYPLNRFDSVQTKFLTTQRKIQFTDDPFITFRAVGRENLGSIAFLRDVSQGRYLETTSGYRLNFLYEDSNKGFDSSLDYHNAFFDIQHFTPALKDGTVAFRAVGGASFGSDRQFFRAGGNDLLRGYGRFDIQNAGSRFVVTNLEYRFPIAMNLNAHVWFIFPDFLFKNIYGSLFMDTGLLWENRSEFLSKRPVDLKHSLGAGLRFQAFVLQTFPVSIQIDFARRTMDGEQVVYLGLGPHF